MKIQPSRHFEGSGDPQTQLIEYMSERVWNQNDARASAIAVFFRAASLGMQKREAVKLLTAWLASNTELHGAYQTLMGWANFAYRAVQKGGQQ